MQLIDELAAALHDLPSERYSAVTRALSRIGIHVSKSPVPTNDSDINLFIHIDLDDNGVRSQKLHEARFDSSNRCWKILQPPPNDIGPDAPSSPAAFKSHIGEQESFDDKFTRLKNPANKKNNGLLSVEEAPMNQWDHETPQYSPDWTDQLPLTAHVEFLKSRDWASTELGPIERWPASLRLMSRKMLADPRPANLYWGQERIAIYNEPFATMAHNRHPQMMGSSAAAAMPLTWPFLKDMFNQIERTGVAFSMPEFEMTVEKMSGFIEEALYDGVFSPITADDGKLLGFYNSGYEITAAKMLERRSRLLHQLANTPNLNETTVWRHIVDTCQPYDRDVPLLAIYSAVIQQAPSHSPRSLHLESTLGIDPSHLAIPESLDLQDSNHGLIHALRTANSRRAAVVLGTPEGGDVPDFFKEGIEWRGHGRPATHIAVIPIFVTGLIAAFVVAGLNPMRPYDEEHHQFTTDFGRVITALLSSTVSFNQAQAREAQLTKELTQREKFIRTMAEVATVGIFNLSFEGAIIWANTKYFEITGLSSNLADLHSSSFINYTLKDDQHKANEAFERCCSEHVTTTCDIRLKKSWIPPESETEHPRWVLVSYKPYVEDGQFHGVLGCVTDISHLKWAEQLQKSNAEAAVNARVRQERFIDLTSHELRNPLSAVIQCADDICRSAERATVLNNVHQELFGLLNGMQDSAQTILLCAEHQKRIVDDILTVSKLDSSLLTVTPVVVNPISLVRHVTQMFKNEAAASDINLTYSSDQSFDNLDLTWTHCDPTRVSQILVNLITNALKFTKGAEERSIEVHIGASAGSPPTDVEYVQWHPSGRVRQDVMSLDGLGTGEPFYLVFLVRDTGKGITRDEMSLLFNRFAQAHPKTHVQYGGSGLGLFLSRELTELQGGQIGSTSIPGRGSTFIFYIKTTRATAAEIETAQITGSMMHRRSSKADPQPAANINGKHELPELSTPKPAMQRKTSSLKILMVEDNLVNQKVLSKQLERAGCTVHIANHGLEGLDFIRSSRYWHENNGEGPDISFILMDVIMPIMDGLTCTRQIRQMEQDGSITTHLKVIATTANARAEQVQMALDAGVDDVLAKPFKVADVMKKLASMT